MRRKMTEIINNALKGLVSFFLILFINKALSVFRKRQLYLSCWNSLKNTSISNNACTINGSVYNKGKDKEKNVEISMPSGFKLSLVSSDYSSIKTENGKIIIDRILPKQKISIIVLVEGLTSIDKKTKPEIKSEDANGKTYLSQDSVPPSMGWIISFFSFVIFTGGFFAYVQYQNSNPFSYVRNKYNEFHYSNLYNQGFSLKEYMDNGFLDIYDIKNNKLPVDVVSVSENNGYINYVFKVHNRLDKEMKVKFNFDIVNSDDFYKKLDVINDEYTTEFESKKEGIKKNDIDKLIMLFNDKSEKAKKVYEEHNVDYQTIKSNYGMYYPEAKKFEYTVRKKDSEIIKIDKKIKKDYSMDYLNINIEILGDKYNEKENLYLKFEPKKSPYLEKVEDILSKYK